MRWTAYSPKEGDERIIKFFAWLPVHVGNEFRWFEKVIIHQSYWCDEWVNR